MDLALKIQVSGKTIVVIGFLQFCHSFFLKFCMRSGCYLDVIVVLPVCFWLGFECFSDEACHIRAS